MGPLEFQGETVSFRFAEALASAVMGSGVPEREAGGVLEKKCAHCVLPFKAGYEREEKGACSGSSCVSGAGAGQAWSPGARRTEAVVPGELL